jgi:hypothetical protein
MDNQTKSVSVLTGHSRPRLIRQITNPEMMHYQLFQEGVTMFCSCRQDCAYIQHKSEECNYGGDSGCGYKRFYINVMMTWF